MKNELKALADRETLSLATAESVMKTIVSRECSDTEIVAFLSLTATRNPTVDELLGYQKALISFATRIPSSDAKLIDVCGTGGDRKGTFNISTITAFVVAAAGQPVAKHGNYAASSKFGSSNLLEGLKITFPTTAEETQRYLDRFGLVFLHAPLWHPVLKGLREMRAQLGFRTVFNLLGPLLSPIQLSSQVVGVPTAELQKIFSDVLTALGRKHYVVSSQQGHDEVVLYEPTSVIGNDEQFTVTADLFDIKHIDANNIQCFATIDEVVADAENILKGKAHTDRINVVAVNAALALYRENPQRTLLQHFQEVRAMIQEGLPYKKLEQLREGK